MALRDEHDQPTGATVNCEVILHIHVACILVYNVGELDGVDVGLFEGTFDGTFDGLKVGENDGADVGAALGRNDGNVVGTNVGCPSAVLKVER